MGPQQSEGGGFDQTNHIGKYIKKPPPQKLVNDGIKLY